MELKYDKNTSRMRGLLTYSLLSSQCGGGKLYIMHNYNTVIKIMYLLVYCIQVNFVLLSICNATIEDNVSVSSLTLDNAHLLV